MVNFLNEEMDQLAFTRYLFERGAADNMTLDYRGSLFLTLLRFESSALAVRSREGGAGRAVYPAWDPTAPSCFLHNNGFTTFNKGVRLDHLLSPPQTPETPQRRRPQTPHITHATRHSVGQSLPIAKPIIREAKPHVAPPAPGRGPNTHEQAAQERLRRRFASRAQLGRGRAHSVPVA